MHHCLRRSPLYQGLGGISLYRYVLIAERTIERRQSDPALCLAALVKELESLKSRSRLVAFRCLEKSSDGFLGILLCQELVGRRLNDLIPIEESLLQRFAVPLLDRGV